MKLGLSEFQSIPTDCSKCGMAGDIGAKVEYIEEGGREYLKCLCTSCGYWWKMKTKDNKKEA